MKRKNDRKNTFYKMSPKINNLLTDNFINDNFINDDDDDNTPVGTGTGW